MLSISLLPTPIVLVGAECEENLALRHIQSALQHQGHEVTIIPFNSAQQTESAARALANSGAALAGLSMVFTYRAQEFAKLAVRARQLGFNGHLVAGGHFAAFHAAQLLHDVPAIDSVAIGEGEQLMTQLAGSLHDLSQVPGLVWRDAHGQLIHNPTARKPRDLDALPWPTHKDPPDDYLGLPIANMLASRGCSHACDFCSIAAWHDLTGGARVRMRSVEAVATEMADLYQRGYRIFNFHDDNFLFRHREQNLERLWSLHAALRPHDLGRIALAIKSRPDSVDRDVFALLRELGVFRVFVGIEAGTDLSLRQLGRNQTVADNDRALAILDDLDFHTCFNILLFNPDSTLEDFADNARYLKRHAQHPLNFCRTEVYTGTPLEQRLRGTGRLQGDYWGYGYTIADPRAQRAFELMHQLLFDRHHGTNSLHHLTMRLDYERKLLTHFFHGPASLDQRVRQFIAAVNGQSADFLLAIAHLARQTSASQFDSFHGEIQSITTNQVQQGMRLLQSIRLAALAASRTGGRNSRTASVGVAATLAVLSGVAGANLALSPVTQAGDRIIPVTNNTSTTNQPSADKAQVAHVYQMAIASMIAQELSPLRDVDVAIDFDDQGVPSRILLFESPHAEPKPLSDEQKTTAQKWIAQLGAEDFKVRQEATRQLQEMGADVAPLLRQTLAQSNDPEVAHRCQLVIDQVDRLISKPTSAQLVANCRTLRLPSAQPTGTTVTFTIRKTALERLRFPTHICEMAPAPLD